MMNKLKWAILMSALMFSAKTFAFFEARFTYGQLSAAPDFKDLYNGTSTSLPSASSTRSWGGDAIISLPFLPGIGIRYEKFNMKTTQNSIDAASDFTRTAVLMNLRLIDTILFLGPIASYGTSHSGNVKITEGTKDWEWSSDTVTSYQIGLEAGIKLLGLMIGVEGGHQGYKWKDAQEKNGLITTRKDIDMSGTYVKGLVGFSF